MFCGRTTREQKSLTMTSSELEATRSSTVSSTVEGASKEVSRS